MTDFNIRRGLSTVLFTEPGIINSNIIIEEGCWYLCTDTAELYLGVQTLDDKLILKKINSSDTAHYPTQTPDDPIIPPEEPAGIIEKILVENLPVYDIDETGSLNEVPFSYINYDSEGAVEPGSGTGFYQIIEKEGIIESGYEHHTEPQEMYYMIALPSQLILGENVIVKGWDEGLSSWNDINISIFTSDYLEIGSALVEAALEAPEVPDGYTLWADLNDINPGKKYRFIIIEEA
jgi:hypothetical protein